MKKIYLDRLKKFSNAFIKDVIETTLRIHKKDQKAYPLRVWKSVSKRWKHCYRYKIQIILNYLEHLGMFRSELEPVEEYRERMQKYSGLYQRGCRRKYFYPSDGIPATVEEYRKISHKELGIPDDPKEWDYPV